MGKLQIEKLVLGMVSTNCYLLKNTETNGLLIIDPADNPEAIAQALERLGGQPEAILLTHGHFDHIGAAARLHERYGIPVCAFCAEREILEDPEKNLTAMLGPGGYTLQADRYFSDRETLALAGFSIEVIHTPGHTAGSCSYYLPEEETLFSGDTLFRCSVGRTDFPTGSAGTLHRSVHERLFALPEETKVYPGHESSTTIGYEKRYNPF